MSKPSCDACSNLREYNANFIMNGVTDDIAASLANNTGLNACLTDLHTDCEDLNDVNDCLIGHMDDDVDNYEVCDWKSLAHNFFPNLYETLKAMIASICGLWTNMSDLGKKIEAINAYICKGTDSLVPLTNVYGTTLSDVETANSKWVIAAGLNKIDSCDGDGGIGAVHVYLHDPDDAIPSRAYTYTEKLAEFEKSQLVPDLMTEKEYEWIYTTGFQVAPLTQGTGANKSLFMCTLWGSTISLNDGSDSNPNDHSKLILYSYGYIGGTPTAFNRYVFRYAPITYLISGHHS